MKTQITRFNQAEHIDINDPDFIREYLEVMLDENGIEGFLRALHLKIRRKKAFINRLGLFLS